MRAVCQRVSRATVAVDGKVVGSIGPGLLVLLAAGKGDGAEQVRWMAEKISGLRIFPDTRRKNESKSYRRCAVKSLSFPSSPSMVTAEKVNVRPIRRLLRRLRLRLFIAASSRRSEREGFRFKKGYSVQ